MPEILSLFNLGPEKISSLRGTIENNHGEATMIVHHDFSPQTIEPEFPPGLARVITQEIVRGGVIFWFKRSKNPPLIDMPAELGGTILEILTKDTDPRTTFDPAVMDDSLRNPQTREDFLWRRINELGVTRVHMAGRILDFINILPDLERGPIYKKWAIAMNRSLDKPGTQEWLGEGSYPFGCVGNVTQECIARGIDVHMTDAVSPKRVYLLTE